MRSAARTRSSSSSSAWLFAREMSSSRRPASTSPAGQAKVVVVGIKETGNHRAALRLAAQEARYRDAVLIAVMAYGGNSALGAPAAVPWPARSPPTRGSSPRKRPSRTRHGSQARA